MISNLILNWQNIKRKKNPRKSHNPLKKEEEEKNSPGTRKIDLWPRPVQLRVRVEWPMEFALSSRPCFAWPQRWLPDTVQFRVIHKYMVAHFIFFSVLFRFQIFNIQVQVYFLFIFFRSHNQPKHIKKRVKIKKLVSKNLPKKSQEPRAEYFIDSKLITILIFLKLLVSTFVKYSPKCSWKLHSRYYKRLLLSVKERKCQQQKNMQWKSKKNTKSKS